MNTNNIHDLRAEFEQLDSEARELLTRADGDALTGADAGRYTDIERRQDAILAEVEAITQRAEQLRQRVAGNPAYLERGSDPGVRQQRQQTPERGALYRARTLTRQQDVRQWAVDNGHIQQCEPLSFDAFMRGVVTGEWDGAEHERAMVEGTPSAGGFLVPTPLAANVLDLARNATRVIAAGAITVPMTSQTLKLPRLVGEGAPAWRNEGATVTQGDLSFDTVTLTARSLTRLVLVSRELFEDSNPSAGDVIAQSFGAQIALELDRVALRGSGTAPEPRGVLNTSGVTITAHGANGGTPSYDWLLDSALAVRNNNYEPTAFITAPRTLNSLQKLKDAQGQYLSPPPGLPPLLATKQVPTTLTVGTSTDTSEIYAGQWNQLAIGIRTQFQLEVLRERWIDNMQVGFLAHIRADIAVLQPGAFAIDTGVRP